jgi:hypothetical protein
MMKETAVTYFKGLFQHVPRGIEVNHIGGFQAVSNLGFQG